MSIVLAAWLLVVCLVVIPVSICLLPSIYKHCACLDVCVVVHCFPPFGLVRLALIWRDWWDFILYKSDSGITRDTFELLSSSRFHDSAEWVTRVYQVMCHLRLLQLLPEASEPLPDSGALPSARALSEATKTFSKRFAECYTRQTTLDKLVIGKR